MQIFQNVITGVLGIALVAVVIKNASGGATILSSASDSLSKLIKAATLS